MLQFKELENTKSLSQYSVAATTEDGRTTSQDYLVIARTAGSL